METSRHWPQVTQSWVEIKYVILLQHSGFIIFCATQKAIFSISFFKYESQLYRIGLIIILCCQHSLTKTIFIYQQVCQFMYLCVMLTVIVHGEINTHHQNQKMTVSTPTHVILPNPVLCSPFPFAKNYHLYMCCSLFYLFLTLFKYTDFHDIYHLQGTFSFNIIVLKFFMQSQHIHLNV